jgi:hypothetical protein
LRRIALRLLFNVSVMRARLSLAVISLFCSIISTIYTVWQPGTAAQSVLIAMQM